MRVNGKVCIVKSNSCQNAKLAALTLPNHWRYATRHGYDLQIFVEPWETAKWGLLSWTRALLDRYEHLFLIGSDVIITRPELPISKFYTEGAGAVVARETLGLSPINNDTVILTNNDKGRFFLDYIAAREHGPPHKGLHQGIIVELMAAYPDVVAVKQIQGVPIGSSPDKWTPKAFCVHFLFGDLANKMARVRGFLKTGKVKWNSPATRIATYQDRRFWRKP